MVRTATSADLPWIRELAAEAYGELGDYGTIIPAWVEHPGVMAFVDVDPLPVRRGFVLLGFYQPDDDVAVYTADLLALAVAREFRRLGVGRKLLQHAISLARLAERDADVREMRLTVAEDNAVGQRLYTSAGFHRVDEDHGHYDGGQRAIRMVMPLRPASSEAAGLP